jgi:hypothetical protein
MLSGNSIFFMMMLDGKHSNISDSAEMFSAYYSEYSKQVWTLDVQEESMVMPST